MLTKAKTISVTGTKGKTTTVYVIDEILRKLTHKTLRVDTTGHFVNGVQKSTLDDSLAVWHLVPTKAPGRYLWEFRDNPTLAKDGISILECSLGCSGSAGLGYNYHDIGIFLNVFEDHLGGSERIKTRNDIAEAKAFIFQRITPEEGYAIFNADDELVVEMFKKYGKHISIEHQIAVGLNFSVMDTQEYINKGGVIITVDNANNIVAKTSSQTAILASLSNIPWTFDGEFLPSVWNCMAAFAAVYALYKGVLPDNFKEIAESVRLDKYGGRITLLEASNGAKIIADYAHEKQSLAGIAHLAKTQIKGAGHTIGVVRMAYDRPDKTFLETGEIIGESFDQVVVYEKIDGYWRKAKKLPGRKFLQIEGRVSKVVYEGVKRTNKNVIRIEREDEAIKHAAEIAKPNDVVVVIVNDNIRRSIDFIKNAFSAEFM